VSEIALWPMVTPETEEHFLRDENNRLVGTSIHDIEGSDITTAALPVNQTFNLIELTHRDVWLAAGLMESSDHVLELNPQSLYLRRRGQIIEHRLKPHQVQRRFWLFEDQRQYEVRVRGARFLVEVYLSTGECKIIVPRYERNILGMTLSIRRGTPLRPTCMSKADEGVTVYIGCMKQTNIQDRSRPDLEELLNRCRGEIHNQELVMARSGKRPDADARYLETLREREKVIHDVFEKRKQLDESEN
jgi:hypothetical protein